MERKVTDRPILFSAPMVKAILAGRKTQTRRVIKPQPPEGAGLVGIYGPGLTAVFGHTSPHADFNVPLRYMPKDRLWVKEAHFLTDNGDEDCVVYAADEDAVEAHRRNIEDLKRRFPGAHWDRHLRLRPSIHMPKWASRLTLVVTDVRVHQVQEISESDAEAEGIVGDNIIVGADGAGGVHREITEYRYAHHPDSRDDEEWRFTDPVDAFEDLWDSINADRGYGWDQNPWVVAISFTVHKTNIDAMQENR